MNKYFENTYRSIWVDAYDRMPDEICGIIVDNEYRPYVNMASDRENNFKFTKEAMLYIYELGEKVQAIIHSHINYNHLSGRDIACQKDMGIPWGVAFLENGKKRGIHFWGDSLPVQNLVGRPFIHGLYDCYSLIKDYYKVAYRIKLPNVVRDFKWWCKGEEDLILENFEKANFEEVKYKTSLDIRHGDVLLFRENGNKSKVCHCAVFTKTNKVLHHAYNQLSGYFDRKGIEPLIRMSAMVVRSKELS